MRSSDSRVVSAMTGEGAPAGEWLLKEAYLKPHAGVRHAHYAADAALALRGRLGGREVAALRIALREVATRDFVRSELRDLLEEMESLRSDDLTDDTGEDEGRPRRKKKNKTRRDLDAGPSEVVGGSGSWSPQGP